MLKFLSIKFIRFYQRFFSKKTCCFIPSCSEYALEAIMKRGFFVGVILSVKRIIKCNPWNKGGLDRVPDKKSIMKWVY